MPIVKTAKDLQVLRNTRNVLKDSVAWTDLFNMCSDIILVWDEASVSGTEDMRNQ